ncbi:MAG: hypothetical protein WC575_00375 [Patescibacteria group bacterium]
MDIFSHGLWTSVIYSRIQWCIRLWAILFGVLPDLSSFGILFIQSLFGGRLFGPPQIHLVPDYIYVLYNISHSLIIWLGIFLVIWLIYKKPWWPLAAAVIHIVIDIPSHAADFFPTPFLWPLSSYTFDGYSWAHPNFMIVNYGLLIITYIVWYLLIRKHSKIKKLMV